MKLDNIFQLEDALIVKCSTGCCRRMPTGKGIMGRMGRANQCSQLPISCEPFCGRTR